MHAINRRSFLGTTVRGLAATLAAGPILLEGLSAIRADSQSSLDTIFLTWQRDPTTTMMVQWVGADGIPPDILVSTASGTKTLWSSTPTTSHPFPFTDLRVYRAELTGLLPGTEYEFRIGTNPQMHYFRTMPAKATDSLTFVSGGDCGVNSHTAAVNILAARQDPYFAVIGGDLAYDNGNSPQTMLGFLRNYSRHMIDTHGRMIPLLACIGNHEVNGGYARTRAAAPLFLSLFDGLFRDTTYATLDFGDYLSLVLLDTGHVAPIAGDQTDWLDKTLRERVERAAPHCREPCPGLSFLSFAGRNGWNRSRQSPALGAAVREAQRRLRPGTSRPHLQADPSACGADISTETASSTSAMVHGDNYGPRTPRRRDRIWLRQARPTMSRSIAWKASALPPGAGGIGQDRGYLHHDEARRHRQPA